MLESLKRLKIQGIDQIQTSVKYIFYKYKIIKSPFFYVKKVDSKIVYQDKDFKIYSSTGMCWASATPCSYAKNLKVTNLLHMKVVQNKNILP